MGKEDKLRSRKELNEEKLTKLYKELEKSKEGSTKLFVVYNKVLMKNKTLEIDKEVQRKEILNLSEIIDQEREKSRLTSCKSEENECLKKITEMETVIKELNEKLVQSKKNLQNKNEEFESYKIETITKYKNMHNNNTELLYIAKEEKEKYKLSIEENEMLKRNNSEMETIVK
jgi:hypothetical protein